MVLSAGFDTSGKRLAPPSPVASTDASVLAPPEREAAPSEAVRMAFAPAADVAEAEAFTKHLAQSHYENFSVVSWLLPRHLRQPEERLTADV